MRACESFTAFSSKAKISTISTITLCQLRQRKRHLFNDVLVIPSFHFGNVSC